MRFAVIVVGTAGALLSGCTSGNQTLLASGGERDFTAMGRVSASYGDAEPDRVETIEVEGQPTTFKIWFRKSEAKMMVQTGSLAGVATTAFIRGLTAGLVNGSPSRKAFREAGAIGLAAAKGPDCAISHGGPITRDAYEWGYECRPRR
ncbi:hypothetical protein J2W51_002348 [Tardiphaga robiniae]|nr:hypothetical protein [Tardiphaga robiniae]